MADKKGKLPFQQSDRKRGEKTNPVSSSKQDTCGGPSTSGSNSARQDDEHKKTSKDILSVTNKKTSESQQSGAQGSDAAMDEQTGISKENMKNSPDRSDAETVTIVFRAIVSDQCKLEDETKIEIRGEAPIFHGWDKEGFSVKTKKRGQLVVVKSKVTIPLSITNKCCAYKYVLLNKKNKPIHEELVEFQKVFWGTVNRCLSIEKEYIKDKGVFYKYDGFIYPKGGKSAANDRKLSFETFFPKLVDERDGDDTDHATGRVKELEKLKCLYKCTCNVLISTNGNTSNEDFGAQELKLEEVFKTSLLPKIDENVSVLESTKHGAKVKVNAVVSSVIIAYVFSKYKISPKREKFKNLLKCFKLPPDKVVYAECLEIIAELDDKTSGSVIDEITKFYQKQAKDKHLVVNLLFALPLLHFLRHKCKPFEELTFQESFISENMWNDLEQREYQEIQEHFSKEAITILPNLIKVFSMDHLLKKTFLLLCPLDMYGDLLRKEFFSCLELCVAVGELLHDTGTYSRELVQNLAKFFKEVNQTLPLKSSKKIPKERQETMDLLRNFDFLVQTVLQHLKLDQVDVICHLVQCSITTVELYTKGNDLDNHSGNEDDLDSKLSTSFEKVDIPSDMLSLFHTQTNAVIEFILNKLPRNLETNEISEWNEELQAWKKLLSSSGKSILHRIWQRTLMQEFTKRIQKVSSLRQIKLFCQSESQECNSHIAEHLDNVAYNALKTIVEDGREVQSAFNQLSEQNSSTYCTDLLCFMLVTAWPRKHNDLNCLNKDERVIIHLLTWSPWPGFLKIFGNTSRLNQELLQKTECSKISADASVCLKHLVGSVGSGKITVATLKLLQKHRNKFFELIEINEGKENFERTKKLFGQRVEEMEFFLDVSKQVECFLGFSNIFMSVDNELKDLRTKAAQNYDELSIDSLCAKQSGKLKEILFKIENKFYDMISKITELKDSQILYKLWNQYGEGIKEEVVTLKVIHTKMWSKIYDVLKSTTKQFLDGKMQLEKLNNYVDMFKNCEALEKEFRLLISSQDTNRTKLESKLKAVIKKVDSYQKLSDAWKAAKAVLKLKKTYGLRGHFSEVLNIEKMIKGQLDKQLTINSISEDLLETVERLKKISASPLRQRCLEKFTGCFELVTWLRENIKDGQQLQVFVDLAMTSAGEDDMKIDRISCMYTSCLGFGSLIFNYNEELSFDALMKLCEPVWEAAVANINIGEQLDSTNQYLSWFKQIKKSSHGSVAVTTMSQVTAINSFGIYYIAHSEKNQEMGLVHSGVNLCLENLIRLVVPADKGKTREQKVYSLEEVKDIQSKLMLTAGKAKDRTNVDLFNEVLDGVLRISHLYMQLCEAGVIKYLTWKDEYRCSMNEDSRDILLNKINKNCEIMEAELEKWKIDIIGKRQGCYSLNLFSMKQILNLRKDLASACSGQIAVDELPLQTFTLLETISKSVDPSVLANLLRKIVPYNSVYLKEEGLKSEKNNFEIDKNDENLLKENVKQKITFSSENGQRWNPLLETFISAKEALVDESKEKDIEMYLLAALQDCGRNTPEDDLIAWVLEDQYEKDCVKVLYEKAKQNPELSDLVKEVIEKGKQPGDNGENVLSKICANKRDNETTPEPGKPYIGHGNHTYLKLEVLADILKALSDSEATYVQRKLPTCLKEGEPNLLLVPKGDLFGSILSLFMENGDKPLPNDEEVVVCDESTTAEEIELLWRRAVGDKHGQLFCLASADLLDYNVSQEAISSLEILTKRHTGYHLVVICSSENQGKSHMVASLHKFLRQFPQLAPMRVIQNYLKRELQMSDVKIVGDVEWKPAASVDFEKLSVRVVQSSKAGMGKSLLVKQLAKRLVRLPNNEKLRKDTELSFVPVIPVHGTYVKSDSVTRALLSHAVKTDIPVSRIFHLDLSQSVVQGFDSFLFKLVILGVIKDCSGNLWRRKPMDMYVVEITTDNSFETLTAEVVSSDQEINNQQSNRRRLATGKYSFVKFLPRIPCLTPRETLNNIQQKAEGTRILDMESFQSDEYQRTIQYLMHLVKDQNFEEFSFKDKTHVITCDPVDALKIIIKHCGIPDPSWADLHHFVNFLNIQLNDCEKSVFCDTRLVGDLLKGFRTFVVRFMIQMSRDFATRSLNEHNIGDVGTSASEEDGLAPFQIRRHWESSSHPYILFNHDHNSMTFLGFQLNKNGDLLDPRTKNVLIENWMNEMLRRQLQQQGVDFDANYEERDRLERIRDLCSVMGIKDVHDPDPTYILTTDNVKKILAVHMRFRCGIPVIIMGETGCGKTRLIKFMCQLQAGRDRQENLVLMKVHGGTTYTEIEKKVEEAETIASSEQSLHVDTILFFDEANTTDAIDLIKEIMIDRRVNGRAINPKLTKLHFIAACNPYRKHTDKMIQKLESAGLGYHVSADETDDKLGLIPLRQLVYRVHPLPESMKPLVWDFGQLSDYAEELYIKQIVQRFRASPMPVPYLDERIIDRFEVTDPQAACIVKVLSESQKYMRSQKNDCSYVSLRDVERAMKVIAWFYLNSELIIKIIEDDKEARQSLSKIVRAVILGIGVCYYSKLNKKCREVYCRTIAQHFDNSFVLPGGACRIQEEIIGCQYGFLKDAQLGQNIARNTALSENVFMMAICAELRIPLFVVGKPGSSKSLAKNVISSNMKAANSKSELFKNFKQIHIQSYQCSPLSTAEGIMSTFKQCAKLQNDKDLRKFVSVVVLDEVGLAEDSPLMPLKTLHPLLEDDTVSDTCTNGTDTTKESENISRHYPVGFIGLSNWALDPAKMNRGIMLTVDVPSPSDLINSAGGICSADKNIGVHLNGTIQSLCQGYSDLYKKQTTDSQTLKNAEKEEFFGLRDFYSLVKMVYSFAAQAKPFVQISQKELEKSIRRNFGGLDDVDPVKVFSQHIETLKSCIEKPSKDCVALDLIKESLNTTSNEGECRYLLVLTENYAALRLLESQLGDDNNPLVIFGSSFPKDQQYTQICRNINRIKVCMETGKMVILLNLESLYESLYDALNQYYVYLGDQKYVDLGLGNHRMKCRVADQFKLIVIAEKDDVYKYFPIPLINRLEKHLLVMSTGLTELQARLTDKLEKWIKQFSEAKPEYSLGKSLFQPGDGFVGYNSDTAAAVIREISNANEDEAQIIFQSKCTLLQCVSPDALARLPATNIKNEEEELLNEYFMNQSHGSLKDYLFYHLQQRNKNNTENDDSFVQVTTHSPLLSQADSRAIASAIGFKGSRSRCIGLQEFNTEQQFTRTLHEFFVELGGVEGLLFVQCDNGDANFNLIACCRYLVREQRNRTMEMTKKSVKPIHIIFIVQLPKMAGGCGHFVGFQGGNWKAAHIDELLESSEQLPEIKQFVNRSISELFRLREINVEVVNLLKKCTQAAVARIYDESTEIGRGINRIEILLEWLSANDSRKKEFSEILVARIHKILQQRDARSLENQKLWVHQEAMCQERLQEAGTFRKALWLKLSSILTPVLSEMIAYCDANCNLNLLREGKEWKTRLWLRVISNEEITPISYDSFISPSGKIRERARVPITGAESSINVSFPFSWIIKDLMKALLPQVTADPSTILINLRNVYHSTPLGILLKATFDDENIKEEVIRSYLNDFLHMMYKPTVKDELQLISDAVLVAARQILQSFDERNRFDLDIPSIHYTYYLIEARLTNFSKLVQAFPDLVEKMLTLGDHLAVGEMILDVVAFEYLLQQLEPSPGILEDTDNRLIWCDQVHSIHPILQVMKNEILTISKNQTPSGESDGQFNAMLSREKSADRLQNCRATWSRLDVVRMFIEHTCTPGQSSLPPDANNAFQLWEALGKNPDFSTVDAVTTVEKFLKNCSDNAREHSLVDTIENYNSVRNCYKSFFMELVSVYCFGEQLPSPDLVRKFICYVIKDEKRTEDLTPFDKQGIDVTPIIRSYILQQLLAIKENEEEVNKHLKEYLSRANSLGEQRDHLIEVCVLFIQCIEDAETVKLLKGKKIKQNVEIIGINKILKKEIDKTTLPQSLNSLNVQSLKDIAAIRAALDALSKYLDDDFAHNFETIKDFKKCLETAKHLCSDPNRAVLQSFLLKQLMRHDPNGIDAVKKRCADPKYDLKWIMPLNSEEQLDKTPDTFVIHQENYRSVRDALGKVILTSSVDELKMAVEGLQAQPGARSCYILLAVFREVTTRFSHAKIEDRISVTILEKLSSYIESIQSLPNELKVMAGKFLSNFKNAEGKLLQMHPETDRQLIEVLVHFVVVMKSFPRNSLLQPLVNLAFNPASMTNAFIPTMPHDNAAEVFEAVRDAKLYECPNGHRYVITECGYPTQRYICPTCKLPIGGSDHKLEIKNRPYSRLDQSRTGHILGRASAEQENLTPERELTPLACGVLRCLTHIALLVGTDQDIQSIAAVIKPQVEDTVEFLKKHIRHDIRCIARFTGNRDDEAMQVIHLVLACIVNNLGEQWNELDDDKLTTKESTATWEHEFEKRYLNPVLSNISQLLQESMRDIAQDERLGNNRLMRLLHEVDEPNLEAIGELSPMCPALWRNRKKITIEYVYFKFQEYSQGRDELERCEILAEFLKKEHCLRALLYFPDIIKLQRVLLEKFLRRLDRREAGEYTKETYLKNDPQADSLFRSFEMAWKIVRSSLLQNGPYSISQEMCDIEVKSSTPISLFLPSKSGLGICALALNNFLVTLHNDFVGRCRSLLNDESRIPEVSLANITKAHLVAYDPDKDFLPMIFANCDYSLEVGAVTTIDFNWKSLERQLFNRLIKGRPKIISLIELFVFSKDICDAAVFKALTQKIPQVKLSHEVQRTILEEMDRLDDICEVLKLLYIAIGFLSSAGGDPSMKLYEYLSSGLKITLINGLKSTQIQQDCKLEHIVSLWLLLSLKRARILTERKQDPFDDVSDNVKSSLDEEKFDLNGRLHNLENLDYFVRELLEIILLYLKNVPVEQLHYPLCEYINAILEEKGSDTVIEDLEKTLPGSIKVEHAVEVWKAACKKKED